MEKHTAFIETFYSGTYNLVDLAIDSGAYEVAAMELIMDGRIKGARKVAIERALRGYTSFEADLAAIIDSAAVWRHQATGETIYLPAGFSLPEDELVAQGFARASE